MSAALAAIEAGEPLPAPFDDMPSAWRWLQQAEAEQSVAEAAKGAGESETILVRISHDLDRDPFAGPVHRPSFALPSIFSAADPDPRRATIETLTHASATFSDAAAELHSRLRAEFGLPPR